MTYRVITARSKRPIAEFVEKEDADFFTQIYNENKSYEYFDEHNKDPEYLESPQWEEEIDGVLKLEISEKE